MLETRLQLFGGRGGASGAGAGAADAGGSEKVSYDNWGDVIKRENVYDESGKPIGRISDTRKTIYTQTIEKASRSDTLDTLRKHLQEDGKFGSEVSGKLYYNDFTSLDVRDISKRKKNFKPAQITGVDVKIQGEHGPRDAEAIVWGRQGGKSKMAPEVTTKRGRGTYKNVHIKRKPTGEYFQRWKTTKAPGKGYIRELIRQSTIKPIEK